MTPVNTLVRSRTPLVNCAPGRIGLFIGSFWHVVDNGPWDSPHFDHLRVITFDVFSERDQRWVRANKVYDPADPYWALSLLDDDDVRILFGSLDPR